MGRLEPGALADIVVIAAAGGAKPFERVVQATERDSELVLVGGALIVVGAALMLAYGFSEAFHALRALQR